MKTLKLFSALIIAVMMGAGITACKKDLSNQVDSESPQAVIKYRNTLQNNMPSFNGERLVFESTEQLKHFYGAMAELSMVEDEEFDYDEYILSILPEEFMSSQKKFLNDEFSSPEERYLPFLSDYIMRALVNIYYEFEVGGYILTYINNKDYLVVDTYNLEALNEIRTMLKGNEINFENIPIGAYWGDATDIEIATRAGCGCDIKVERISCTQVNVKGNCKGNTTGNLSVIWGGENPLTGNFDRIDGTFNSPVTGNFNFNVNVTTGPDTRLRATVEFNCLDRNDSKSVSLQLPIGVCDYGSSSTIWDWEESRQFGFEAAISFQTKHWKNNWGAPWSTAEVYSYGTNNVGGWSIRKGNIRATVDENNRSLNINIGCSLVSTHSNSSNCSNCKSRKARVSRFANAPNDFHCDGDVVGSFVRNINFNGNFFSLNRNQSLNFSFCCP